MKRWEITIAGGVAMTLSGAAIAQNTANSGSGSMPIGTRDATTAAASDRAAIDGLDNARREARYVAKRDAEKAEKLARRTHIVPALPSDLVAGAAVRDAARRPLGTIEQVGAGGVQLLFDGKRAMIPADGFGKDADGLLVNIARTDLEKAVAAPQP